MEKQKKLFIIYFFIFLALISKEIFKCWSAHSVKQRLSRLFLIYYVCLNCPIFNKCKRYGFIKYELLDFIWWKRIYVFDKIDLYLKDLIFFLWRYEKHTKEEKWDKINLRSINSFNDIFNRCVPGLDILERKVSSILMWCFEIPIVLININSISE